MQKSSKHPRDVARLSLSQVEIKKFCLLQMYGFRFCMTLKLVPHMGAVDLCLIVETEIRVLLWLCDSVGFTCSLCFSSHHADFQQAVVGCGTFVLHQDLSHS